MGGETSNIAARERPEPPNRTPESELEGFKERVLRWQMRASVVLTVPYSGFFGWLYYSAGMFHHWLMVAVTTATILLVALTPGISHRVRAHAYLAYLSCSSLWITLLVGPVGTSVALTIALMAFGPFYATFRVATAYLIVHALGFVAVGYLHTHNLTPVPPPTFNASAPLTWYSVALTTATFGSFIGLGFFYTIEGMKGALRERQEALNLAHKKSNEHEKARKHWRQRRISWSRVSV